MTRQTSSTIATPREYDAPSLAIEHLRAHGIDDAHVDQVAGHLYLRGIANCYRTKQAAAKSVIDSIPGLTVVNELRVIHEHTDDADVAATVASAIHRVAPNAESAIRVFVVSGDVYLRGRVADAHVRERTEAAVWECAGVMRVHNELVAPDGTAEDDDLASDIARYVSNLVTLRGPVSVRFDAGVVHLEGEVSNAEQRDIIEELVRWHDAVRDVTNALRVREESNLS